MRAPLVWRTGWCMLSLVWIQCFFMTLNTRLPLHTSQRYTTRASQIWLGERKLFSLKCGNSSDQYNYTQFFPGPMMDWLSLLPHQIATALSSPLTTTSLGCPWAAISYPPIFLHIHKSWPHLMFLKPRELGAKMILRLCTNLQWLCPFVLLTLLQL